MADGLLFWDINRKSISRFTQNDGLPSNTLYRIESDDYGYLWISSENGLIRFNPKNKFFQNFSLLMG